MMRYHHGVMIACDLGVERVASRIRASARAAWPDRSRAASCCRARSASGPRSRRNSRDRPSAAGTLATSSSGLTMLWQLNSTGDVEVAAAQRLVERAGRQHPLRHLEADLAPLVDHPGGDVFVGLVDVAVHQLEAQALGAGLLQQPPRLGARLLDVGPEAGDLLQLLLGRGQRRAGEDDAADGVHGRRSSTAPARPSSGRSPASARGAPARRRTASSCGSASAGCRSSSRCSAP